MYACMYKLQGGVPSSINVGDTLSLRFQAQDSFANDVFVGGAGKLLCVEHELYVSINCSELGYLLVSIHTKCCT
jgi:hypothetical protein